MSTPSMYLVVAVLAGVLALIGAAARILKLGLGQSQAGSGRVLVLRESISLDPRRRVHLVQCGHRHVVLLTGGGQDLVVGWMQDP